MGRLAVIAAAAAAAVFPAHAAASPLAFEQNAGQAPAGASLVARSGAGVALLYPGGELVARGARVRPAGARAARAQALGRLPGVANYYRGRSRLAGIPTFAAARYAGLYQGVDLLFRAGAGGALEYDFRLAPRASARRIALRISGRGRPRVARDGSLLVAPGLRELRPRAWQPEPDGSRRVVAARWIVRGRVARFALGRRDPHLPLVVDPVIVYSTFLGGSSADVSHGVGVDGAGDTYVSGYTQSADFPATPGSAYKGSTDAFVTKLAPGGQVLYSTYLGGSGYDSSDGLAVDSLGDAYLTGRTGSSDFPTLNAVQPTFAGGHRDGFVTKLTPAGTLAYSTFLGGSGFDLESGIAIDGSGAAYVTGHTTSTDFPTAKPLQPANAGSDDTTVTKLSPSGSSLDYSTYLGGSAVDEGGHVAVDSNGSAFVVGHTSSTDHPLVAPAQSTYGGADYDGLAFRLSPDGHTLVYCTYLGGGGTDFADSVAIDGSGNAYVAGETTSTNFPTAAPLQPLNGGGFDAFATKLAPGGAIAYSTYLGGSGDDVGHGMAVDSAGDAFLVGDSSSPNYPTASANQPANGGGVDAFLSELSPGGNSLPYSTYLGGTGSEVAYAIALSGDGAVVLTGNTSSPNFPVAGDAAQSAYRGGGDAFVLLLDLTHPTPPPPPSTPPPPPPPPPAPRVRLGGARVQHPLRKRRVYVLAHSSQTATLTATATVVVHGNRHRYRLRPAHAGAQARRTVKLYLRASGRTLKVLRRALSRRGHPHALASIQVTARTSSATSRPASRHVTLRR